MANMTQRLQRTAARVIARAGERASWQLYAATKSKLQQSETFAPTGSPVLAAVEVTSQSLGRKDGKSLGREEVLHVEIPAFEAHGGLTQHWRVTLKGVERRIKKPVMSDDGTYYVCRWSSD